MTNRKNLLLSITILLLTTVVVGIFGIVPFPEYKTSLNKDVNGKIIYFSEIQSKNIIPPAPDIIDSCLFEINLDENPLKETVIICRSDLSKYSYEIYFFDAQLTNNNEALIRYWSDSKNSESILLINIETKKVTESNENLQSRSSYKVNSQGERILDYWEGRNPDSRNISLYYQKDNEVIEVFSETAPTNYYFESSNWSQSGKNIVALDSEGQIILFSKNKTYQPTKLIYEELKHGDQDDSRIVSVIGWRD